MGRVEVRRNGDLDQVGTFKETFRMRIRFPKDTSENASPVAQIANGVYGADTVTANYVQFWFRRFSSGIFDVKDAPHTGRPVVENVDKITEIIEVYRHELLPHGQTLNLDLYCQQLDRLKLEIEQKRLELANRRGFVFHQDNASTYTSVVTRQNLWELSWEVLMQPPYSSDLVPSDYHLFLALQNLLSDKKLGSREDCENRLLDFFANKGQDFYESGIMKLPLKWQ
ncbi:histone-lysine N-methyltransferase SETMAR [Trichonephila clavipes]|nr:histone-lysine N-methyltransferase SETMAR [Trichonephila clavipes]